MADVAERRSKSPGGVDLQIRLNGERWKERGEAPSDSSSSSSNEDDAGEAWEVMAQIEDTLQALDQEQQDEGDGDENSAGDESEEGGNNNGRGGKEKRVKRTKATKKATKKERKEKAKSEKANVDKREGGRSPRGKDTGKKGDGAAAVANNGPTSPRKDTQSKKSMLRFLRSGLRGSSVGHYKKKQAWSHLWEGADLEDPAKLKKVVLLQSAWRRQLARRLRKKLLIANELLKTEENYVRALSIVCNSFYYPLLMLEERKSPLLDKKDVEAIFSVAGKLYEGQQLFLGALRARIMDLRGFDRHSVGDIFLEQTAFFDLYTTYINNYDTSIGTLKRCKKDNPNFTKFISKCEANEECEYQDLPSFLIQPIQRIPRYVLLLADLMRKTAKGDKTYRQLSKAVQKMRDMTSYFNEQKRDAENADYVDRLYARFLFPSTSSSAGSAKKGSPFRPVKEGEKNPLLADSKKRRRFIREGDAVLIKREKNMGGNVIMKKPSTNKRGRERRVVLFNDLLVLCSPIQPNLPPSPSSPSTSTSSSGVPVTTESRTRSFRHSINLSEWSNFLPRRESREAADSTPPFLSPRARGSVLSMRNSAGSRGQSGEHQAGEAAGGGAGADGPGSGRRHRKTITEGGPAPMLSPGGGASPLNGPTLKVKEVEELWKIQAVVGLPESYGENVFQIKSFKYTYLMAARTPKEKDEWMQVIHSTRERLYRGS